MSKEVDMMSEVWIGETALERCLQRVCFKTSISPVMSLFNRDRRTWFSCEGLRGHI
jgi:hypothetical protein